MASNGLIQLLPPIPPPLARILPPPPPVTAQKGAQTPDYQYVSQKLAQLKVIHQLSPVAYFQK